MGLKLHKFQATGNDFILYDNRQQSFKKSPERIANLCHRRFGIGADGFIFLEKSLKYDFKMVYYNSDGYEGTMCGNGGRSVVAFAKFLNIINKKTTFEAIDGLHTATILNNANNTYNVKLQMKNVQGIEQTLNGYFLDTGSPHHVCFDKNIADIDVFNLGKSIRYNAAYKAIKGVNVNFVEIIDYKKIQARTYERGVEAETYSCGTGATAVALAAFYTKQCTEKTIEINTKGGTLIVSFDYNIEKQFFFNVYLAGQANHVFEAKLYE